MNSRNCAVLGAASRSLFGSFSFGFVLCALLALGSESFGAVQSLSLVKFRDDFSAGEKARLLRDAYEIAARDERVLGFQWGTNNSPEGLTKGFTHGFVVTYASAEARAEYLESDAFQAVAGKLEEGIADLFSFSFEVEEAPPAAEVGRVHHLVFFRFKEDAEAAAVQGVVDAFATLPQKISGLLRYQAGTNVGSTELARGFTHAFLLTFVNERARNDYLPHPAHKAFVSVVGPVLAEPLVVDFTVTPADRSLFVTSGLEPYRVYQRSADGTASIEFGGVCSADGKIEARLRGGRRTVPGFDWREVGAAVDGAFTAVLAEVPTGGEYTVEVRRRDRFGNIAAHTEVANVLVGDLWILAGQSNMEGVGDLDGVTESSPLVHCFTMAHRWEIAREPLHWLVDSPDPVHSHHWLRDLDEAGRRKKRAEVRRHRRKGAGLGLPFAVELVRRTGVPIGLIASAHGGTSMTQWDPTRRDDGGSSLYGSMFKQVKNAGGAVKGVLWYQGESDALDPAAVPLFEERFEKLVAAFRRDFEQPELPFYSVQLGRFVVLRDSGDDWNRVQDSQRILATRIPHTAVVAAVDLPLDDLIHIGTDGLKRLGRRLALTAHRNLYGGAGIESGPQLAKVSAGPRGFSVRVEYSGVNGRLTPERKIDGFSLHAKDGKDLKLIYRASVDPSDGNTVVLKLRSKLGEETYLRYGAGLDPVCTLADESDMSAPVFGPIRVGPSN